ncbi:MAG: cation diffusion facilitator family transporter [Victivallales bacterium]
MSFTQHSAGPDMLKAQERAVRLGVLLDVGSLLPVLVIAVLSGSMLLYSDLLDYARSITAGIIAWGILRQIRKGDVQEYDYGTGKMESLGGLIGSLIFMLGLLAMSGFALHRIFYPIELNAGFTALGVLSQFIGLLICAWLWWRNLKLARQASTPLIEMEWRAKRADTLNNLAVMVGLVLTLALRSMPWSVYIDPVCALIFTAYGIGSFIPTVRDGILDLLDKTLVEELQLKINRNLAINFDGYAGFHGVRSRRMGHRVLIDIALSFDPKKKVAEVMRTVENLREGIKHDIPNSEVSIILEAPETSAAPDDEEKIQIMPLSKDMLPSALKLIRSSFRIESDDKPEWEMEECLEPGMHAAELRALGISNPRYWVLCGNNRVLGVTGIYINPKYESEAVWGTWSAYDTSKKGKLSRNRYRLMRKVVHEAHSTGRKYLRLCTSDFPEEREANHLYDHVGFTTYMTKKSQDGKYSILYRQAELQHLAKVFKLDQVKPEEL